jgi:hypothetical protein
VARKARVTAARRSFHERAAAVPVAAAPITVGPDRTELRAVLDEEMVALPERYRAPLVLCYLEGLTNEEAARRLGWAPGSMSYRLARGRDLLRRRLARRGLVCLALWPVFMQVLTQRASAAGPVPEPLVKATVDRARGNGGGLAAPAPSRRAGVPALLLLLLLLGGGGAAAVAGWAGTHSADPTPCESGEGSCPGGGCSHAADAPAP